MRTFEVVLLFVNLASVILSFRKQPTAVWARLAGINVFVLFLHGLFEGIRYQLTFSYIFVILLAVFALLKTSDRFPEIQTSKARKLIVMGLALGSLGVTAFLAHALPVFTLPRPTGSYDVGVKYFHLTEESRTNPFLDPATQKRELMVKVYYPAKKDNSKPFSPYFHNSPKLIRSFTTGYGMPDFMFDHLQLVRTNSKEDLQLSDERQSYPVILFSHGAGTTMEVQISQSEDLASQGYIVVAIDHTYVSVATAFPDRIVSAREATTDFHTAEPAEIITRIMADDATFVIEQLSEMNAGNMDPAFRGKLNLEQIGVIGHSVGGAVAYNLAIHDSRVKAAINLDGRVYITPEDPENMAPFLMLASDTFHQAQRDGKGLMQNFDDMTDEEQERTLLMYSSREAYQEAYTKDYQNMIGLIEVLEASGNLFTIEGSEHMKFIDIGLFIGDRRLRELFGIGGKTDPRRCLEITQATTLAFFDRYLKGETSVPLEALVERYPELKQVDLKK